MGKMYFEMLPYLQKQMEEGSLPAKEVMKLIRKYKREKDESKKEEIREKVINANLKLVLKIAIRQARSNQNPLDFFQSGIIGIMIALEKFSTRKKTKFSTYAYWWIKSLIQSESEYDSIISVPYDMRAICGHYEVYKDKLKRGKEVNKSESKKFKNKKKSSLENASSILFRPTTFIEIDKELPQGSRDSKTTSFSERLEDSHPNTRPDVVFMKNDAIESFKKIIKKSLPRRERDIIITRYFEGNGKVLNLEEVGKIHNLSRETVRKAERCGIQKLKQYLPSEWAKLFEE